MSPQSPVKVIKLVISSPCYGLFLVKIKFLNLFQIILIQTKLQHETKFLKLAERCWNLDVFPLRFYGCSLTPLVGGWGHCCTAPSAADSAAGSKTIVNVSHKNVYLLYFPSHPGFSISVRTFSTFEHKCPFPQCSWMHHQQFIAIKHQLFSLSFLSTNINCFLIKLLFLCFSSSLLSSNQTLIVLKETQTGRSLTCPPWDNARLYKRSV